MYSRDESDVGASSDSYIQRVLDKEYNMICILKHGTLQYSTVQRSRVECITVRYCTVQCVTYLEFEKSHFLFFKLPFIIDYLFPFF